MNNTNIQTAKANGQNILWTAKPTSVKEEFRKWYSYFPKNMGLFEKVISTASIPFAIYYFIVNGVDAESLTVMIAVMVFFIAFAILKKYLQKQKFNNSNYILTEDEIEITSWSLFGGQKVSKLSPKGYQ